VARRGPHASQNRRTWINTLSVACSNGIPKMGETIIGLTLGDILAARIICATCNAVAEVDVEKIGTTAESGQCRFCHEPWFDSAGRGGRPLTALANAFEGITKRKESFTVEFVVRPPE